MSDPCYLVQEIDGVGRFTLEDGSGFILLEYCPVIPPTGNDQNVMGGRLSDAQAQWAETARMRRLEDMEMEEIMAVLLSEL